LQSPSLAPSYSASWRLALSMRDMGGVSGIVFAIPTRTMKYFVRGKWYVSLLTGKSEKPDPQTLKDSCLAGPFAEQTQADADKRSRLAGDTTLKDRLKVWQYR